VHIIKLPNPSIKMTILKIIIFVIFETILEFKPSMNQISGNPLALHECCLRTAITIATVAKIVCLSGH
jgi:hypothetical protein